MKPKFTDLFVVFRKNVCVNVYILSFVLRNAPDFFSNLSPCIKYLQVGHNVLLHLAEMLTLVLQVIPHTTAVFCYRTTHFKKYDTILNCRVDLFMRHHSHARNNSAPYYVGYYTENLCGDTFKSKSHCVVEVFSGSVALLCHSLVGGPGVTYNTVTGLGIEVASHVERAALVTYGQSSGP
jgi:hypothetical protein